MSDAELDPHVLISAKIGGSQKLLGLPSHRARWGWIVMLGHAKLHRPPGRFDSLQQARYLAGEFRDCVTNWLDVGLLHALPALCDRCLKAVFEPKPDEIFVHDWRAHQERRSRTTTWRDENGVPSGHVNLSDVSPSVSPPVSPDGSPAPVYAGASRGSPPLQSGGSSSSTGARDAEAPALAFLASVGATIQPNGNGYHRELVLFVDRQGAGRVTDALRARHAAGARGARALLFGAMNDLEPIGGRNSTPAKGHQVDVEAAVNAFKS